MSGKKKWQPKITMRQFEEGHIAGYNQKYSTLPCNCGEAECVGWGAILRINQDSLQHHLVFCLPSIDDLSDNWPF